MIAKPILYIRLIILLRFIPKMIFFSPVFKSLSQPAGYPLQTIFLKDWIMADKQRSFKYLTGNGIRLPGDWIY
jgi:hypothetical protein